MGNLQKLGETRGTTVPLNPQEGTQAGYTLISGLLASTTFFLEKGKTSVILYQEADVHLTALETNSVTIPVFQCVV